MLKLKKSLVGFGLMLLLLAFASVASHGQTAKPPADVNVLNTPDVKVVNTPVDPVAARDVDNPGRQPFTNTLSSTNNNSFLVPAGKRLVIEYVSGGGFISTGQKFLEVGVLYTALVEGRQADVQLHFVPALLGTRNTGTNLFDIYTVSQQTRVYVEPGGRVQTLLEKTSGVAGVSFTVSGYLVDVP